MTVTETRVIHATQPWVKLLIDALAAEGIAPNLVPGNVTSLDPGSDPTFALVETGPNTYRFDLGVPRGVDGLIGKDGKDGIPGKDGIQGIPGDQGVQGIPGVDGADGIDGAPGIPGIQGERGLPGRDGIDGIPGVKGDQGIQGEPGIQGVQGTQGIPGVAGRDGVDGVAGAQGQQGVPGVAGADGLPGSPGAAGAAGAPGSKGDQGIPGVAGVQGDIGPAGPSGLTPRGSWSATITYVPRDLVTYGGSGYYALDPAPAKGTAPTADPTGDDTVTNTGWAFLVLEGARGPQGIQGLTGTAGAAGTIAINSVTSSAPGTTATVVNRGTSTAALLDITLPRGADGIQGIQGLQGIQGVAGVAGKDGAAGAKGDPGIQGIQGIQGTPGTTGTAGTAGRGITSTTIDSAGHLQVTYSDGSTVDAGSVQAATSGGRGITNAVVDATGHLILSYSDNTSSDLGKINGTNGTNGADGVGYTAAAITGGHLILTRSTGGTVDVGQVVGTKGDKGDPGETGASGIVYRGIWSPTTTYAAGDAVNYNGPAFWSRTAHTNIAPTIDGAGNPVTTSTWAVLSLRGAKGETGATGADGASPTITLAPTQQGATGSSPNVANLGTPTAAQFQFTFPPPAAVVRKTLVVTAAMLAPNSDTSLNLALSPSYTLVAVKTSVPARLRIYSTGAAATRDISRAASVYPATNAEMVLEFVTAVANQTYAVAPGVIGASLTSPPVASHAALLANLSSATADVVLTLTYLTLEN